MAGAEAVGPRGEGVRWPHMKSPVPGHHSEAPHARAPKEAPRWSRQTRANLQNRKRGQGGQHNFKPCPIVPEYRGYGPRPLSVFSAYASCVERTAAYGAMQRQKKPWAGAQALLLSSIPKEAVGWAMPACTSMCTYGQRYWLGVPPRDLVAPTRKNVGRKILILAAFPCVSWDRRSAILRRRFP